MWKSRLFWKLFIAYSSLFLISTAAIVFVITKRIEGHVVEQTFARLTESATLAREIVSEYFVTADSENLQSKVLEIGNVTGTRLTLVDPDGKVLADSECADVASVLQMKNHKNREELVQAASEGYGSSQRESPTLDVPMLYVAVRAEVDGKMVGLVRTARPRSFVMKQIYEVRQIAGTIIVLVSLGVVALTYWMVTRIIRPVSELTIAAESIGRGGYGVQVHLSGSDELSQLATAFNSMSGQLLDQVNQMTASKDQISIILSSMHEGIIAVDRSQRILFANKAAGTLFDFVIDKAIGSKLLTTIRNDALLEIVRSSLSEKIGRQAEIEDSGTSTTLEISTALLPGDLSPGVVVVVRDITELRHLETIRQEFVANVSHELKTPLTSIKAYAETLSQGAIDDAENRMGFVKQIEDQAERLNQLIVDILTLARVESGRESFELQSVSLLQVADNTLAHFKPIAESKNIALSVLPSPDDVYVKADSGGVRQILDNIVENAVRYTPENGMVTVSWKVEDAMAVIDVKDDGIGIREEDQARLFERFFRVEKARSRELGGTGLGLSIVKHLSQFFGGTVGIDSKYGEGSTFTVRLPIAK